MNANWQAWRSSTLSWLSSNCMCVISTFWTALLLSFSFVQRVFFCVITLFSSAVWVQDNYEPPKGWKIDEENDSERRKKMSTINFHHIHIIFYGQTVFMHFCCLLPVHLFSLLNCYTFFLIWEILGSLDILVWDGKYHNFSCSNESKKHFHFAVSFSGMSKSL